MGMMVLAKVLTTNNLTSSLRRSASMSVSMSSFLMNFLTPTLLPPALQENDESPDPPYEMLDPPVNGNSKKEEIRLIKSLFQSLWQIGKPMPHAFFSNFFFCPFFNLIFSRSVNFAPVTTFVQCERWNLIFD